MVKKKNIGKSMYSVYIDLESLLDFRERLLSKLGIDFRKMKYRDRTCDLVPNRFGHALFKEMYNLYLPTLLDTDTKFTRIDIPLTDYIVNANGLGVIRNETSNVDVYLDCSRFSMDRESFDSLEYLFRTSTFENLKVNLIFLEKPLTMAEIEKKIAIMFLYNGFDFIRSKIADGSIYRHSIPDVMLMTPMLHQNENIGFGDVGNFKKDMTQLALGFEPLVMLKFEEVKYWCCS